MEKTKTIETVIRVGDAGIPYDVTISVWYTAHETSVVIHNSEDEGGPDNPPNWWPEKIGQIIEESFLPIVDIHFR